MVVFVFLPPVQPLPAEQGVVREGGVLRRVAAVAIGVRSGVWLVDNAGFSLLCAHGLIVLFRRVVVAAKVPAQLADVTTCRRETDVSMQVNILYGISNSILVVTLTYLVLKPSRLKWASSLGLLLLTSMCVWCELRLKSCRGHGCHFKYLNTD